MNTERILSMLNMCQLCQNCDKVKAVNLEEPEKNQCFEARRYVENYAPFKNDKKQTVRLTCDHFSHIKTAVINFKGGGRVTIRATAAKPNLDLSDLPMFRKEE